MVEVLKLSNPIMINGEQVKELNYNFDELTPSHYAMAETKRLDIVRAQKESSVGPGAIELDYTMHLCLGFMAIVAQAECEKKSITFEDVSRIKGKDINQVAKIGRNFISPSVEGTADKEKQSESHPKKSENA